MVAALKGHMECVKLLIQTGADLVTQSKLGRTALMECVKVLIREIADLDIPKERCSRALMWAVHTCSDTCLNTPLKALEEVDFSISRTMLDKKQTEPPLNPQDTTGKILNLIFQSVS